MTTSDWMTLATVVTGVGSAFAIPFGIWMAKVHSGQKVLAVRLRSMSSRMNRLENMKSLSYSSVMDQLGALNDRVNEHSERTSEHSARLIAVESDVKDLRGSRV